MSRVCEPAPVPVDGRRVQQIHWKTGDKWNVRLRAPVPSWEQPSPRHGSSAPAPARFCLPSPALSFKAHPECSSLGASSTTMAKVIVQAPGTHAPFPVGPVCHGGGSEAGERWVHPPVLSFRSRVPSDKAPALPEPLLPLSNGANSASVIGLLMTGSSSPVTQRHGNVTAAEHWSWLYNHLRGLGWRLASHISSVPLGEHW